MDDKVLDLVNQDDHLQVVIRCHLVIEHFLVKIIEIKLPNPKEFQTDSLNFRQKVELAIALNGINKGKKGILLSLNKLRNRYAHDIEKRITEKEITELEGTLSSQEKEVLVSMRYYDKQVVGKLGGLFLLNYAYLAEQYEYHEKA